MGRSLLSITAPCAARANHVATISPHARNISRDIPLHNFAKPDFSTCYLLLWVDCKLVYSQLLLRYTYNVTVGNKISYTLYYIIYIVQVRTSRSVTYSRMVAMIWPPIWKGEKSFYAEYFSILTQEQLLNICVPATLPVV